MDGAGVDRGEASEADMRGRAARTGRQAEPGCWESEVIAQECRDWRTRQITGRRYRAGATLLADPASSPAEERRWPPEHASSAPAAQSGGRFRRRRGG